VHLSAFVIVYQVVEIEEQKTAQQNGNRRLGSMESNCFPSGPRRAEASGATAP